MQYVGLVMDFKPDFLVIGAARSGTTALYNYLRQHPDIYMPSRIKEPNFYCYEGLELDVKGPGAEFINNSVTDGAAYEALFAEAGATQIKGEASPLYLYEPRTPERIAHHAPDVKMIAILRNPIEQAHSHFLYATRLLVETEADFEKALGMEEDRLAKGWQPLFGYSSFPRYGAQLAEYFEHFDRAQFLIETYDDFDADPMSVLFRIYDFLGADGEFEADMSYRPNAGGVPKSQIFQDFLIKPNPVTGLIAKVMPLQMRSKIRDHLVARNLKKSDLGMSVAARNILRGRLKDDVARLSDLLTRDLSHWLK